jgi:phytoene dehydrogenase-like protein
VAARAVDAVVIGAGHNGLVAANLLADRGWDVVVLESAPTPGGAVRTAELTVPGYHHDVFSAFYPLGFVSPALVDLHLEDHGLRWLRAPIVLAHPTEDGPTAVISTDPEVTAASLERFSPGDGDAWLGLYSRWCRLDPHLVRAVLDPFPPIRSLARSVLRLLGDGGPAEVLRFARFALLPVRRMGEELFGGEGARLLLAGNAAHADVAPDAAPSGLYGWLLSMLAQQVGFPVPAGGAGRLVEALVARLAAAGGELVCGSRVEAVCVRDRRAVGVRTANGEEVIARRAVIADVDAPSLYLRLVGEAHLPPGLVGDLRRFEWDPATLKVDWALSAPVPWADSECRQAGTVHLADSVAHIAGVAGDLASGTIPQRPYCVVGQQSMTDQSRMPPGCETLWAYAHLPRRVRSDTAGLTGDWSGGDAESFADRIEAEIARRAPGFAELVVARHVASPADLEAADANLVGGSIGAGTSQLHQQLFFRPVPGLARGVTPIAGLYLASASAHPGPGVHGAPGRAAARAALRDAPVAERIGFRRPRRPPAATLAG